MRIRALAVLAAFCFALTGCRAAAPQTECTLFVMDTAASVKGTDKDVQAAAETLTDLGKLFDRYDPESDIYSINNRLGKPVSGETKEIITHSVSLCEEYGGDVSIFAGDITDAWRIGTDDPVVPSEEERAAALEGCQNADFSLETMSFANEFGSIDLGSVAKGYALDKIAPRLSGESCVVSMSSSILLNGRKADGERFAVAVRDPEDGSRALGTLRTEECFLSTSGGSERFFESGGKRYIHIFDLKSGAPAESDLTSVTVIVGRGTEFGGMLSDFLSTLIFIGGTGELGKYMENSELGIIAVTNEYKVYISKNIDFSLAENSGCKLEVWE